MWRMWMNSSLKSNHVLEARRMVVPKVGQAQISLGPGPCPESHLSYLPNTITPCTMTPTPSSTSHYLKISSWTMVMPMWNHRKRRQLRRGLPMTTHQWWSCAVGHRIQNETWRLSPGWAWVPSCCRMMQRPHRRLMILFIPRTTHSRDLTTTNYKQHSDLNISEWFHNCTCLDMWYKTDHFTTVCLMSWWAVKESLDIINLADIEANPILLYWQYDPNNTVCISVYDIHQFLEYAI